METENELKRLKHEKVQLELETELATANAKLVCTGNPFTVWLKTFWLHAFILWKA